jgi:glycosyltransferase involved in cell wall biosynthesis
MRRDRVVFWQEAPYGDRSAYERALAERLPQRHVAIVVGQRTTTNFKGGVWGELDVGMAEVVVGLVSNRARELLDTAPERSVHIFSSFVHSAVLRDALETACRSRALVGLMSEARDWSGAFGLARRCHSVLHERRYRHRVDFVLAIGSLGQEWFEDKCGYPAEKVFPWCYVSERAPADAHSGRGEPAATHVGTAPAIDIVFVGALIQRKAVDVLLKALAKTSATRWRLAILGGGEQEGPLRDLSKGLGVADRVSFAGMVSNVEVRRHLRAADLLVLPSHWDGWVAVINEALMAGVPVICSDWCGAKVLIRPGWNGDVFRTGSVQDLARVLDAWLTRGPLPAAQRDEIRAWSRCIEGDRVAQYLLDIIAHVSGQAESRPAPPWAVSTPATPLSVDRARLAEGSPR